MEQKKESKKRTKRNVQSNESFSLLWKFMRNNRKLYILAVLGVGLATLFSFVGPLVMRTVIDSVIGSKPVPEVVSRLLPSNFAFSRIREELWMAGALIVFLTLGNGLFTFLSGRWKAVASEELARDLRERLYDHLQKLPYDYHVKAETGDLIQRCTSDVETVRRFIAVQLVEVGRALFMIATALPIMFSLNVRLTLVAIPVIPVIFFFSYFFFRNVQRAFKKSDEAEGRLSTVLQENLTGVRVVRAFAREQYETGKFDEKNREYRDLTYKLIAIMAGYWSLSDFLSLIQMGTILTVGSLWAVQGNLSIGILVVFMTYEGMLLWPIRQMGRILADMGKALVAAGRINEILTTPEEDMNLKGKTPVIRGGIEFSHVHFAYQASGKKEPLEGPAGDAGDTAAHPMGREILKDITFSVKPGMTVAVLGATGSGKSTLMHLLPRLYEYTSGSIKIDGVELKEIQKPYLRRNIGYVLQEPFLYAKNIKENIGLAKRDTAEAAVFEAARSASVHEVILGFDKGYETLVGERGVTLSGGQKQRVAIARALVMETPILIFDDSLSAVDTETDAAIRKALMERSKNTTTFIISHRLTTLQEADMILVLEEGMLTEIGTHQELIEKEGVYKRIWELQNSLQLEFNESVATGAGPKKLAAGV